MKNPKNMKSLFGMVCFALTALAASAETTPWGWASEPGKAIVALTNRTASGGAVLTNGEVSASCTEIRFASGRIPVSGIEVGNMNVTFAGSDTAQTTLVWDDASERRYGGAVQVSGGSVVFTNVVFSGFRATDAGGALALRGLTGDSAVLNCQFDACEVDDYTGKGGAVYASAKSGAAAQLSIRGTTFGNCRAGEGGAIVVDRLDSRVEDVIALDIADSVFSNNFAYAAGGAICSEGDVTCDGGTEFAFNEAGEEGGALCSKSPVFSSADVICLPGVVFRNNRANVSGEYATDITYGGAVALVSPGNGLYAEKTAFLENGATYGGAVSACGDNPVVLQTCVFSNNVVLADGFGAALDIEFSSALTMTNVTVRGSSSTAVDLLDARAEIVNCVVVNEGEGGADISATTDATRSEVVVVRSAFGTLTDNETDVGVTTNGCLTGCTTDVFDGTSLTLKGKPGYNPVAAEGIVQTATDFADNVYGSEPYGYSMGAFECEADSCLSEQSFTFLYDGKGHTNVFASTSTTIPADWTYATAEGGPWSSERPAFTNVGEHTTWAKATFRIGGVESYSLTTNATVTITNRFVHLVSASATKTYDGTELRTNDVWVVGTGDNGLADGDTLGFSCPNWQTTVGTNDNAFTFWMTSAFGEDMTDNYSVSTTTGELVVVSAQMPDPDPDDPNDPHDPLAGPFDGPDLPDPTFPPVPTNRVDGTWSRLSNYDWVGVYDGSNHTYSAAALTNALETLELYGNPYAIHYSMTGVDDWVDEPYAFTNVTETPTSFWYRVSVPNFTNYIHAVGVTITNRPVTVTANSSTKAYDGATLTNWTFTVSETTATTGFVEGEGIDRVEMTSASAIVNTGRVDNVIAEIFYKEGTLESNYLVTTNCGELAVTQRSADGNVDVDTVTDVFYYNNDAKEPKPDVTDKELGKLLEGTDFTYAWLDNTNATETAKVIVNFIGNYAGVLTNDFRIGPRSVTLTSGTQTWTYDGKPHACSNVTETAYTGKSATDSGFGFVPGEGVATSAFTRVTTVTNDVPNAFEWEFANAATLAGNYTVSVTTGRLAIATAKAPDIDPNDPNDPNEPKAGPFDGPDLNPNETPLPPAVTNGVPAKLSNYDWIGVYDGNPHTFDRDALQETLANSEFFGNEPKVTYSLTGAAGTWEEDPFLFVDVTATSFWYRVSADNFTNYIHAVGVIITQRVVQVTSATPSAWAYDMQAHSNVLVTVTKGSFVGEEGVSTGNFATITDVGEVPNSFDYTWNVGTLASNYDFSAVTGKLTVVKRKFPGEYETEAFIDATNFVYTSYPQGPVVTNNYIQVDGVRFPTNMFDFVENVATDVDDYTLRIVPKPEHRGNFDGEIAIPWLIAPVGLSVTPNDLIINQGQPYSTNGLTFAGFVGTDTPATMVGSLDFTFVRKDNPSETHALGERTTKRGEYWIVPSGDYTNGNYTVVFERGTLTVLGEYYVVYEPGCASHSGTMPREAWITGETNVLSACAFENTVGGMQNFLGWATNAPATKANLVFGDEQKVINLAPPEKTATLTAVWTTNYVVYGQISGEYVGVQLRLVPVGAKTAYEAMVFGDAPNQTYVIEAPVKGEYDLVSDFTLTSGKKTTVTKLVDVLTGRTRVDVVAPSGDWNSFVNNDAANEKWNTIASCLDLMATNKLASLLAVGAQSTEIELAVTDKPVDSLEGEEVRHRAIIAKAACSNDVDQLCSPDRVIETFDLTVIRRTTYTNELGDVVLCTTNYPGRAGDEEVVQPVRMLIPFDLTGRTDFWVYRCHTNETGEVDTVPLEHVPEMASNGAAPTREGWALLNERTEGGRRYFVVQSSKFSMFGIGYRGAKLKGVQNGESVGIDWTRYPGDGRYYGSLKLNDYDGWPSSIRNLRLTFPTLYNGEQPYAVLYRKTANGTYEIAPDGVIALENKFEPDVEDRQNKTITWGLEESQKASAASVTRDQLPDFALYIYDGVKPADVTVAELRMCVAYDSYGWTNKLSFVANANCAPTSGETEQGTFGGPALTDASGEEALFPLLGRATSLGADETAPWSGAAQTYDGYLFADETVKGVIQVKVAKAKATKGVTSASVTATVTLADTTKKLSFKKGSADMLGGVTAMTANGWTLSLSLGTTGLSGTMTQGATVYELDGVRNLFLSKDKPENTFAANALARCQPGAVAAWAEPSVGGKAPGTGWNALSLTLAAKGKAKGTLLLPDGTKVTVSGQLLLLGEECFAVPIVATKKISGALWSVAALMVFDETGWQLVGLGDELPSAAIDPTGLSASALPVWEEDDVPAAVATAYGVNLDKLAWKPKYTPKTGLIKSTFSIVEAASGKAKSVTFNGVVIDGVGYGTSVLKGKGSWKTTVR